MDEKKISEFKDSYKKAVDMFNSFDKLKPIRLISHLDADGISAASIMVKILNHENFRYSISIVQQLTKEVIEDLALENYSNFIFTDLGSGQLKNIKEKLGDRNIIILDHHEIEETELPDNIIQINPHLQGINGNDEISGAGVVYFFSRHFNCDNLAHVAIIGATGDIQEDKGFKSLNKEILDDAIGNDKIKVITGLRFFGVQTKPLYKVLEYSTDPFIPGVTGSESGAIQFLQQIGINPKREGSWRKLIHLSDDDIKKLVAGIVMKRMNEVNPEDVLGPVYILKHEDKESPTRDVKEFSTLLNACGRMGKASLGIGACLGDPEIKKRAIGSLTNYKREIVNALKWYEQNQESSDIIKKPGYMIINTKDNILPTVVGTLASILSKSKDIPENTYILSLARLRTGNSKISLRISGLRPREDIDVRNIITEVISKVGGEAGGHQFAAGAVIKTDKEEEFLKEAQEIFEKRCLEEAVL